MLLALLQSMRPKQWVKNLFVLAPLVFSNSLLSLDRAPRAFLGMALFCLVSGAVYLINDVFDVAKDRAHPTKRLRPIPSGRLPLPVATGASLAFAVGSVAAAFALDLRFGGVILAYLLTNGLYSWKLKHVVFVDVVIIALGFLLRTLAGAFAIGVHFSPWLFGCTFLLSLYLALGKRKHEVLQAGEAKAQQRKVLEKYRLEHLEWGLQAVSGFTVAAYTAYTLSVSLPGHPMRDDSPFSSPWLPVTIPFAVLGLTRFAVLASKGELPESPTDRMTRDLPFLLNLGIWGATVLTLIYAL